MNEWAEYLKDWSPDKVQLSLKKLDHDISESHSLHCQCISVLLFMHLSVGWIQSPGRLAGTQLNSTLTRTFDSIVACPLTATSPKSWKLNWNRKRQKQPTKKWDTLWLYQNQLFSQSSPTWFSTVQHHHKLKTERVPLGTFSANLIIVKRSKTIDKK